MNTSIYWALRALTFAVALLPLAWVRLVGMAAVKVFYVLTPKKQAWALRNLESAFPGLPPSSHRRIMKATYNSFGMLFLETAAAMHWPERKIMVHTRIEGLEHYQRAAARGKGVILLTPHLGSFLWGFRVLSILGIPTAGVYQPRKPEGFDRFYLEMLNCLGVEAIRHAGGLRSMAATLKRGRNLGIMLDQNAPIETGIFVPFFGRPACSYPTAALLHRLTGAPGVVCLCIRTKEGFIGRFLPEQPYPDDVKSADWPKRATAMDQAAIEQAVREHPMQWNWIHRRYKATPDGKESFYR